MNSDYTLNLKCIDDIDTKGNLTLNKIYQGKLPDENDVQDFNSSLSKNGGNFNYPIYIIREVDGGWKNTPWYADRFEVI